MISSFKKAIQAKSKNKLLSPNMNLNGMYVEFEAWKKKAIQKKRKILVFCVTELLLLLGNIVTAPARIVKLLSLYVRLSFAREKR